MMYIKQITSDNWMQFKNKPANIFVLRKELIDEVREIGIVIVRYWNGRKSFEINTISGKTYGAFASIEMMIEAWWHLFDFYYIEVKK